MSQLDKKIYIIDVIGLSIIGLFCFSKKLNYNFMFFHKLHMILQKNFAELSVIYRN